MKGGRNGIWYLEEEEEGIKGIWYPEYVIWYPDCNIFFLQRLGLLTGLKASK